MKKILLVSSLFVIFISALFLVRGSEDTWICQNGMWIKHGNPNNPIPQSGCGIELPNLKTAKSVKIKNMIIKSSAFGDQQKIPARFTCDSQNINPPLEFSEIPEGTQSLVLIVDDPDAPNGDWVHWTLWNIDSNTHRIEEGSVPEKAEQGMTSFNKIGYGGPCPPSGTHHYFFRLFALDYTLDLPSTTKESELMDEIQGHILGQAELVGLYR